MPEGIYNGSIYRWFQIRDGPWKEWMDMEQETAGLVLRMAEGDSQAFDRLMEYYYPRILRVAYLISGSHADSEDIVQETFVLC